MAKDFWSDDDLDRPPDGDLDVLAVMEQELEDAAWWLETEHTLYLLSQGGDRLEAALRRLTNWELVDLLRVVQAAEVERRGALSRGFKASPGASLA